MTTAGDESESKYITNDIEVDLAQSRMVWWDGEADNRIELWEGCRVGDTLGEDTQIIWIETNGNPVADGDGIEALLAERGVPAATIAKVLWGDLDDLRGE